MADGLDAMTAMRNKNSASRRTLPPPRHKPRDTPVPMPDTTPHEPVAPPAAAPPQVTKTQQPASAGPAPTSTHLAKVSIYLDETTDTYLETVRAAARTTRPRIDATRSAVVR